MPDHKLLNIENRYCVAFMLAKGATLLGDPSWYGNNAVFHFEDSTFTRNLRSEYEGNGLVNVMTFREKYEWTWDIIMEHRRETEGRER